MIGTSNLQWIMSMLTVLNIACVLLLPFLEPVVAIVLQLLNSMPGSYTGQFRICPARGC